MIKSSGALKMVGYGIIYDTGRSSEMCGDFPARPVVVTDARLSMTMKFHI